MKAPGPVLLFDGNCGFCRIWIDYWKKLTGERVVFQTSQEARAEYPQIPEEDYGKSVQLIRPDGSVASGARAVFESLEKESWYRWIGGPAEIAYRVIAANRNFFYHVTRFTFGKQIEPTTFQATQWLFVRALALVYLIAFTSLGLQVTGLIGEHGILPVRQFLINVAQTGGAIRYLAVPSVFWWANDDLTLQGLAIAGITFALIAFVTGFKKGKFERLTLILLYVLYLSFVAVGQEFFGFQWDALLLETGFLAIFLQRGGSQLIPWMFRWLSFRLFFLSGSVKLLSGDPVWRHLDALSFHWHTQPLPTFIAWYADKLPRRASQAATWLTLAIEIGVPFFVFMPRRIRLLGAWVLLALQTAILLAGNYGFFNLLTVVLLLFWFDDQALNRWVKLGWLTGSASPVGRKIAVTAAALILFLGLAHLFSTFTNRLPAPLGEVLRYSSPLQIVNTYGLFANMTTERDEIIVEGSEDGEKWLPYEFRYKPGDPNQSPRWVAPLQPRLDWQMWFAALSQYQQNLWFVNFAVRLLDGSQAVTSLLEKNPFEGHPPKFIRASRYEYTFTDWETRRRTGAWWKREPKALYLPPVGLRQPAIP